MSSSIADKPHFSDLRTSASTKDLAGRRDDERAVGGEGLVAVAGRVAAARGEMSAFGRGCSCQCQLVFSAEWVSGRTDLPRRRWGSD